MMRKETRGRVSAAARGSVVLIRDDDNGVLERPAPLPELTPEERDEWIALCNAVPATYFPPATWQLVASYCRHVVLARHLWQMAQAIQKRPAKTFKLEDYLRVLREHRAEASAISAHLRTLRLTHLSAYAHDRAPLPEATPKPWLS